MFIELSDGTPVNLDLVTYIRKGCIASLRTIHLVDGDTIECKKEDEDKIKALVLPDKSKRQGCDSRRHVALVEFKCSDMNKLTRAVVSELGKPLFREDGACAIYVTPKGHGQ